MSLPVEGLPIDVEFLDYDPREWRHHPDPEPEEAEDDADLPISEDVLKIVGIDPDEEGW